MPSRLKQLQDRQAVVVAEMRSMLDTCEKEGRDLGAGEAYTKEKEQYASLEKESDENVGKLEIEIRLLEREKKLAVIPTPTVVEEPEAKESRQVVKELRVPATAIRHATLRNFTGPNAEAEAYAAGAWFRAIAFRDQRCARYCRDNGLRIEQGNWAIADGREEYRTAQAEGVNTLGGYLVPEILERRIIVLRETYGVFRAQADVLPMGSDSVQVPRQTGGLTPYFIGENSAITESNMTWDSINLVAKKLATLTKWSTELDEDAIIAMGDKLAGEIAYAFALKEDQCGFLGDGTSTYGGMTGITVKINDGNHAGSIVTAATGHTAFSSLTLSDFHSVTGALPLYARNNAKWYVHTVGFANSMERLMYAGGGNTVQTIGGGSGPSFLGYPVVFSQVLNSTTAADINAIKLLFGDLRLSTMMGTRRAIMLKTSAERFLEYDQLAIVGTERFDINNHDVGTSTVAGPIIALKMPAS